MPGDSLSPSHTHTHTARRPRSPSPTSSRCFSSTRSTSTSPSPTWASNPGRADLCRVSSALPLTRSRRVSGQCHNHNVRRSQPHTGPGGVPAVPDGLALRRAAVRDDVAARQRLARLEELRQAHGALLHHERCRRPARPRLVRRAKGVDALAHRPRGGPREGEHVTRRLAFERSAMHFEQVATMTGEVLDSFTVTK